MGRGLLPSSWNRGMTSTGGDSALAGGWPLASTLLVSIYTIFVFGISILMCHFGYTLYCQSCMLYSFVNKLTHTWLSAWAPNFTTTVTDTTGKPQHLTGLSGDQLFLLVVSLLSWCKRKNPGTLSFPHLWTFIIEGRNNFQNITTATWNYSTFSSLFRHIFYVSFLLLNIVRHWSGLPLCFLGGDWNPKRSFPTANYTGPWSIKSACKNTEADPSAALEFSSAKSHTGYYWIGFL